MQLADLNILQNVTPKWGAGHYLAHDKEGNLLEVLVAERSTESVTALLSWAKALEKVSHPSIPKIQTMVHQEITFVALKVAEGISLSNPLQHSRKQLLRLDILSAFYQLATALKKLHDHGLNHGNLNLDHMKLVGEGSLQLRGWAPPAIETTFVLRQIDELKRFKNFFYLAIVGQFPPTHRHLQHSEQKLTPFQAQCLEAWSQWYHQEVRKDKPNLSSSNLMLFDEVPKDAAELIQELQPHLDHNFAEFYQKIEQELAEREKFETLYIKRQELLLELERAHRATQLWIQQQSQNKLLSDQQTQNLDYIFGEVDLLRSQLERQSGLFFNQSHQLLDQSSKLRNRNGHTQLYNIEPSTEETSHIDIQTFGRSVQDLEQAWSQVNPERPIYVSNQDQTLILNSAADNRSLQQNSNNPQNPLVNGGLLQWAELPPLILDDSQNQQASQSQKAQTLSSVEAVNNNHSVLGIEPLPSYVNIPKVTPQSDQHQTQLFMPDQYDYDDPLEAFQNKNSILNLSSLIPARTKTVYTQHLPELDHPDHYVSQEDFGPKIAFSHKNFFAFLYLIAAFCFAWSLRSQEPESKALTSPQLETTPTKLSTTQPTQSSNYSKSDVDSTADTRSQPVDDESVENGELINPLIDETEAPAPKKLLPPPNMVYIPGGIVNNSLTDEAYNRVVTHCVYEPNFNGRDRPSKERCRRLIRRSKIEAQQTEVKAFFMDTYEVSRGNYLKYCRSGGVCNQRVDFNQAELNLPVVQVSMIQAMDYCRFYKKYLPSYEQWLFAARGESDTPYPWGNDDVFDLGDYRANYKSQLSKSKRRRSRREIDGFKGPYSVRKNTKKGLSPFGVAHMAGNVREWVSRDRRKLGWVTGGSWKQPIWHLRLTAGEFLDQYVDSGDDIGFRCAQDVE